MLEYIEAIKKACENHLCHLNIGDFDIGVEDFHRNPCVFVLQPKRHVGELIIEKGYYPKETLNLFLERKSTYFTSSYTLRLYKNEDNVYYVLPTIIVEELDDDNDYNGNMIDYVRGMISALRGKEDDVTTSRDILRMHLMQDSYYRLYGDDSHLGYIGYGRFTNRLHRGKVNDELPYDIISKGESNDPFIYPSNVYIQATDVDKTVEHVLYQLGIGEDIPMKVIESVDWFRLVLRG